MSSSVTFFVCARDMFPNLPAPVSADLWVHLQHPDNTGVRVLVQANSTLEDLCKAEASLTHQCLHGQWCDASSGVPLDKSDLVAGRCLRMMSGVWCSFGFCAVVSQ